VIASIRGSVLTRSQQQAIIDVSGVGYLINITPGTSNLLKLGSEISLFTSMIVREDAMTLYGFTDSFEQILFDLLRSVTGVGPKSALGILSSLSTEQIQLAVATEDDAAFRAVTGIGPKTAKLITVTLAGKLQSQSASTMDAPSRRTDLTSVIEALIGLGWPERNAAEAVREANSSLGQGSTRDAILRFTLTRLGAGKSVSGSDR
jgi:Holliday junction DNA helicase RuvA